MQELQFVFEINSQTGQSVWEKAKPVLQSIDKLENIYQSDVPITLRKFDDYVKLKKYSFFVENENFDLHVGTITNSEQVLFVVKKLNDCKQGWWQIWIDTFIQLEGFVQAWLVDDDYNLWQNEDEPETYDFYGKPYEHLSLIDNGLPFPLNATIIDTSNNPGVRNICTGYIEAVGANMWISDKFLTLMNQDIETVSRNISAKVEKVLPNVYHIAYPMDVFIDESTEKEQRELRKALFSKADNNPTNIPKENRDESEVEFRAVNPKTGEVIEIYRNCD